MKFTESPRRWRKVLMYISLSRAQSEHEGEVSDYWEAETILGGSVLGLVLGAIASGVIATFIACSGQLFGDLELHEVGTIYVVGLGYGSLVGWLCGAVCHCWLVLRNARESLDDAPMLFLEAFWHSLRTFVIGFLSMQAVLGVYSLLGQLSFAQGLPIPFTEFPGVLVAALLEPSYWTAPAVLAWLPGIFIVAACFIRFKFELARFGHAPTRVQDVPEIHPPGRRLIYRRGRRVNRPLPIAGPKARTAAKW